MNGDVALGYGRDVTSAGRPPRSSRLWDGTHDRQSRGLDDHLIYALVLIGLALVGGGAALGLGRWCATSDGSDPGRS